MKLQQTIDELEKKAAQYTEAANALRIVLSQEQSNNGGGASANGSNGSSSGSSNGASGSNGSRTVARAQSNGVGNKVAKAKKTEGKKPGRKRGAVSPETRAKISAAIKERHQQRKAQAA
jgi:hypothetical protein